ncbi:MAG: hypothetical protein RL112_2859 [Planctomycetota bacterium]|jgi:hypothetical protein
MARAQEVPDGSAQPRSSGTAGWTAPEARGAFGGFIGPKNLLELVRTSAPWLFDGAHPAHGPDLVPVAGRLVDASGEARGWWRILLSESAHPGATREPAPGEVADYFALCCAAHFASAATFVPTDVDAKIRHALWLDQADGAELERMLDFALRLGEWDVSPVSARLVRHADHAPVSGHDGERLSVLGGALIGACARGMQARAKELHAALEAELDREARAFLAAIRAKDAELVALRLAGALTHNAGDVGQSLGTKHAAVVPEEWRVGLLDLARERHERHGGAFALAAELYRRILAPEGHRNYPLRETKCLRKHPSLLYPVPPLVDDWGASIATTPVLATAERAAVVAALVDGLRRVPGQSAYQRALAGFSSATPGGLWSRELQQHFGTRTKKDLEAHELRKAVETPRAGFEASLRKRVRAVLSA